MYYLYLSMMSARLFHSRDLDGLQEALADTPGARGDTRGPPSPEIVRPHRTKAR